MKKDDLKKRIKGTLIGCAYGDAMGMPTEFLPRSDIKELFPEGITTFYPTTSKELRLNHYLEAGSITDDTIHTLLVANMIIKGKGYVSAEAYLNSLRNWLEEDPIKNASISGPSTLKALKYLSQGLPIEKAGILGNTNGASMKISPIGIICDYRNMDKLIDIVEQVCIPTHNNSIAIAGAAAVAACVSYGVRGGQNLNELRLIARKAIELGEQRGFKGTDISLNRRLESIYDMLCKNTKDNAIEEIQEFYGTNYTMSETIPAVFAVIHLVNGNPVKAAQLCAVLGGDTDTYGAIAASICGAMNPQFPDEDVALLERVNHLDFDSIVEKLMPFVERLEV